LPIAATSSTGRRSPEGASTQRQSRKAQNLPSAFYFYCGLADAVGLENNFELRDVSGATVVAVQR
jgi:hypothetical protein